MKFIWLIVVLFLPFLGLAQHAAPLSDTTDILSSLNAVNKPQIIDKLADTTQLLTSGMQIPIDSLIDFSKKFIGTPYRYGGRSPKGFDCSGFVGYVFRQFGVELPPSSRSQALVGEKVARDSIQKGDLVFFKGRSSKSSNIGHVALVVAVSDTNDIQFIHSTRHGLRLDWLSEEPYYKNRFMASRRLVTELTK
jgi:cell wall-associated NlpC family hydrolase